MYTDGSKPYFSVTTIINKVLPKGWGFDTWLKNNGHHSDTIVTAKSTMGVLVHMIVDMMIRDMNLVVTWDFCHDMVREHISPCSIQYFKGLSATIERVQKNVESYITWADDYSPTFIASEMMLYHTDLDWAGTCDNAIQFANGEIMLNDLKTGTVQDSHLLQGYAYAMLWNNMFPNQQCTQVGVLYSHGDYKIKPTYKFVTMALDSVKGRKCANQWNKMMELLRAIYANADGSYPVKDFIRPGKELRLNAETNFINLNK
jgi:hypothetical protein